MVLWMNLYRQGWYHRAGKPGTMNVHPGDLYPSEAAAKADIDHLAPYIDTVSFEVPAGLVPSLAVYPQESEPTGLAKTREQWRQIQAGERAALVDDSGLVL